MDHRRQFTWLLTLAPLLTTPIASAEELAARSGPQQHAQPALRAEVQPAASQPASQPTSQPVRAEVPLLADAPVAVSAPLEEPPPPAPRPIYKRWWFWTVVGVATFIVVAGAVGGTRTGDPRVPVGPSYDSRSYHD